MKARALSPSSDAACDSSADGCTSWLSKMVTDLSLRMTSRVLFVPTCSSSFASPCPASIQAEPAVIVNRRHLWRNSCRSSARAEGVERRADIA
jgi:hypothetical protein